MDWRQNSQFFGEIFIVTSNHSCMTFIMVNMFDWTFIHGRHLPDTVTYRLSPLEKLHLPKKYLTVILTSSVDIMSSELQGMFKRFVDTLKSVLGNF